MIQTSTSVSETRSSIKAECVNDSLTEDEESFYISIKTGLNNLERGPSPETVERILKYSKSF